MSKKEFALIGYPLGHSISPQIHALLMETANIDGEYLCREIPPEELDSADYLNELDGYNVTIPHKINIIPTLDKLDKKAALFGAVNTVKNAKGKSRGYNTDCEGFLRALKGAGIKLGGRVLVLGSGGVSRMFAFESVLAGADVTIAARNAAKALEIKKEIKEKTKKDCRIITLSTVGGAYDLIINGTPVGMYPNVDESPLPKEVVEQAGAVFDAIYNPRETLLLRYAREADVKAVNGLSMLVWQAAVAQEIWNNIKFDYSVVDEIIKQCGTRN
ncbi:MAG: shikimate dehydrogenase [Eubacterium sp.]|nr:shikimate dehydrogenase [Eubacterium sp.]MBR0412778.1 shikimate dehydrogenase [Eubacterium sp.]